MHCQSGSRTTVNQNYIWSEVCAWLKIHIKAKEHPVPLQKQPIRVYLIDLIRF